MILIDLQKIIVVITHPFFSKVIFQKSQAPILIDKDFRPQELTSQMQVSLPDVTSKMQLYYTTYVFMVQGRALTLDGDGCASCCHFFYLKI